MPAPPTHTIIQPHRNAENPGSKQVLEAVEQSVMSHHMTNNDASDSDQTMSTLHEVMKTKISTKKKDE